MSGKCRPSLRAKTLLNVARSNLSTADKKCIHAVFALADEQKAEIERLQKENQLLLDNHPANTHRNCVVINNGVIYTKTLDDCAKFLTDVSSEAVKEFALELKRIPRIAVYKNEIDNLLKERLGESDV